MEALLALLALVIQNTALVILLKLSFRDGAEPYDPSTVVLNVEIVKLFVCSLTLWRHSADLLLRAFGEIPGQHLLLVPSVLYVLQNNLLFWGAQRLSPIVYIVCSQMKIFTTALVSRILLGTTLSTTQYWSLVFLVIGIIIVQGEGLKKRDQSVGPGFDSFVGVAAVLLASLTSGTAGGVLEKVYKAGQRNSNGSGSAVWARNIQLSIVSLPFAFVGTLFQDARSGQFWTGYDSVVVSVILLQAIGGIIIGFVLKYANNVSKCLAISVSICCCAVYSVARRDVQLTASLVLGLLIVSVSVFAYSLSPSGDETREQETQIGQPLKVFGRSSAPLK